MGTEMPKPYSFEELLEDVKNSKPGPCVICGKETWHLLLNMSDGRDYVCEPHETYGCKLEWLRRDGLGD